MITQKNIIKKVHIVVNAPSLANGMQLKDELATFFNNEVFTEMDRYFNSIQKNETEIIRFDTISLEISIEEKDSLNNIKALIIRDLKSKIKNETNSIKASENFKITSPAQNETEAFFYFLENGILPWWFEQKPKILDELFINITHEVEALKKLKALLSKAEIRKRFISQFNENQMFKIINSFLNIPKTGSFETKLPLKSRPLFWEAVLLYSIHKNEDEIGNIFQYIPLKEASKLLQILKENFGLKILSDAKSIQNKSTENETFLKTEKPQKEIENSTSEIEIETDKEGILIQNAGLILLHPFLKMFFEKMDLLSENTIKPEKKDEDVHLLHYLATGREKAYEYELIFEKFLCNIPFDQTVDRHIFLTKEQKMSCEILLEAVMGHWTALKSNSTEILQNEFLQREGKLLISGGKQQLFIQRKTQDILLDKLPWNVHLIKIPWKKKIIFVEW
ncbi:contractile injection system tape measure protein [Aequorivita lipolytica]|uniref:Uncharacterized protein n=1 Tax=Aequorivita lipolytica TaxID=153267 RepID=A0A5C6YQJ5_9FLAO|nr:contractile injection system tape measure protein [Aequorivita lipolytica]TXD69625.1 hypothetical protein ESV24_07265 [Aequorivita lipolytica]SRX51114.1 hypothetical protein AEQU2_01594 [Aequorivita lipolytica]